MHTIGEFLGGPVDTDPAGRTLCGATDPAGGFRCTLDPHPADAYHEAWGTAETHAGLAPPPRPFRWWLDDGRGEVIDATSSGWLAPPLWQACAWTQPLG